MKYLRVVIVTAAIISVSLPASGRGADAEPVPSCFDGSPPQWRMSDTALSVFRTIELGRSNEEVRRLVGQPSYLCGSGIPYDVYVLADGRSVWISFQSGKVSWVFLKGPGDTQEVLLGK